MSDKLSRVSVSVNSLAKPDPQGLLAARTAIRVSPVLQALFTKAKEEGSSAEALADALFVTLPDFLIETKDLWDTALYLADEFMQLGDDKFLLVSQETGQALYKVSEEDIYLPDPVPRETGGIAQPLPRLRPDLEGMLVQWEFSKGRDQKILNTLAQRANQTELLATEGDNRLLRATRSGRKKITDMLSEALPSLLPPKSGATREFLSLLNFREPVEEEYPFTALAKIVMPVADPLTSNLRHDPLTTLKHQISAQWTRIIAFTVANEISGRDPLGRKVTKASYLDALPTSFWLADPNVAIAFREASQAGFETRRILSVQATPAIPSVLLHAWLAPIGDICINPDSYECKSREFLDRWEVGASCKFTLHLDPGISAVYKFSDVPESGMSVEVVS